MKNLFLQSIIFLNFLFIAFTSKSQSDNFAYTVTDSIKGGSKWNYLRQVNLRTGTFSNILLRLLNPIDTAVSTSPGIFNGIASIAYDKKNQRVYYTPLLMDRLSYVDLRTMRTIIVRNNFTGLMPKAVDQSNVFTRMVIADDDYGYALTNDGNNLIRFSTRNNSITNLGSLIDAPGNTESIHNGCSSFGGDIVAENNGNLYLITSRNHIFKIKIRTRVAKFIGTAIGLPQTFITSGVAVDNSEKKLVMVSSVDSSDIYLLNLNSLAVRGLGASTKPRFASDLGNSNILEIEDKNDDDDDRNKLKSEIYVDVDNFGYESVKLFPNPITNNQFKIQFNQSLIGNYYVNIFDNKGLLIVSKNVNTINKGNNISISLPNLTTKGLYIVHIVDKNNKVIFSKKINVQ